MVATSGAGSSSRTNLTRSQRLIWTGQQLHPDAPLYNMAFLFVIDGALDAAAMERATDRLVAECDALRTVVEVQDGIPRQRTVAPSAAEAPRLERIELAPAADAAAATAAASAWAADRAARMFDIARGMSDLALLDLGGDRWGWYLGQHHLATDATSVEIMLRRLEDWYRHESQVADAGTGAGTNPGTDAPADPLPSFADHAESEAASATAREQLAVADRADGSDTPAPGLYGRSRRHAGTASRRIALDLGPDRTAALRELAGQPEARALTPDLSLFTVLATALAATLARVGAGAAPGEPDASLVLGVPVHQRPTPDLRRTVGLLTEVMPLAIDVTADDRFADLAQRVRLAMMSLLMQGAAQDTSAAPTVREADAVLNFLPMRFARFAGHPCTTEWLHPGHHDREHPVRLQVHDFDDAGRLRILFDLNEVILGDAFAPAFVRHFERTLDGMLAAWSEPIDAPDLLDDAERRAAIATGRGPAADPDAATTVPAMFAASAAATPDAVAMQCGDRQWTWSDLDRRSAALAAAIRDAVGDAAGNAAPEDGRPASVAVRMSRCPEAVLAMLAALRAGAPFTPIDPAWPDARQAMVMDDAGVRLVLVAGDDDGPIPGARTALGVDAAAPMSSTEPVAASLDRAIAADPAYILFTSGSTGRPKGVQVPHRGLANYVTWAAGFYGRGLTFPLFTALSFDLTLTSIMVPLVSGGRIVIHPRGSDDGDLSLLDVADAAADDGIDIIKLTPSHLALLEGRDLRAAGVGQLILGGEDLTVERAERARRIFGPDVQVHNEYGPTEATVGCVVHTYDPVADAARTSVPIGRPVAGMDAHVVDRRGRPVPAGVAGELQLGGAGLALGYVGRPDLTVERFAPAAFEPRATTYRSGDLARRLPDGTLEYLGRRDAQVKVRGVRIELGEVEAAVNGHPGVAASVVGVVERPVAIEPADTAHCTRCGLASTYPGVQYDEAGVCNQCTSFETYRERADVYFRGMDELREILDRARAAAPDAPYDCISLLSGGKDSTYMLGRLVDAGARPLAFTLDNGYISPEAKANIRRVVHALGVDHEFGSTPAMNEIFVDSLKRHANVCQGCFKTIYTLSVNRARDLGIPIIMTGLSRGQFFETRLTEELFTEPDIDSDLIDATVLEARKAYHRVDDAVLRLMDVSAFENDSIFDAVRFVDFYRYCDVDLDELYAYLDERLPWVRPSDTGRSTNCLINDVGIWYHRRDRGFHNYALPYAWDVRMGHKLREAALDELDDDIDEANVRQILREIGFDGEIPETSGGERLVAWYVAEAGDDDQPAIDEASLRESVAAQLPGLMVPSTFVRIDAVPLTANGKVDRERLPAPGSAGGGPDAGSAATAPFVAPRTDAERTLAGIWSDVLDLDRVGVHADFFALGGDSIMAIQIVGRARRAGLTLEPRQIFQSPTIAGLAAVADADATSPGAAADANGTADAAPSTDAVPAPNVGLDTMDAGTLGQLAAALKRRERPK